MITFYPSNKASLAEAIALCESPSEIQDLHEELLTEIGNIRMLMNDQEKLINTFFNRVTAQS